MRFKNTALHALDFDLGGKHHKVPVDGEVEIHDKIAYAIKSRGLPLEPIPGTEAQPQTRKEPSADAPPPEGTPARLWFDRAHAAAADADKLSKMAMALNESVDVWRQRAESAGASAEEIGRTLADVRKAFEQHRGETSTFTGKLRAALKIAPEASILEAIESLKTETAKLRADLDAATKPAPRPARGTGSPPAPAAPPTAPQG